MLNEAWSADCRAVVLNVLRSGCFVRSGRVRECACGREPLRASRARPRYPPIRRSRPGNRSRRASSHGGLSRCRGGGAGATGAAGTSDPANTGVPGRLPPPALRRRPAQDRRGRHLLNGSRDRNSSLIRPEGGAMSEERPEIGNIRCLAAGPKSVLHCQLIARDVVNRAVFPSPPITPWPSGLRNAASAEQESGGSHGRRPSAGRNRDTRSPTSSRTGTKPPIAPTAA
jgi:hypothetical protein